MVEKITLTKDGLVKATKSESLIALLEKDGWEREGRKAAASPKIGTETPKRGRKAAAE